MVNNIFTEPPWSDQQQVILAEFERANSLENVVVVSRAGTGKTTVIMAGVNRAPEASIVVCAFSRSIADEMRRRSTNPRVKVQTLHSIGFQQVLAFWENVPVAKPAWNRGDALTERICGGRAPDAVKRLVTKLHTIARENSPYATRPDQLDELAFKFDCQPDAMWERQGFGSDYVKRSAITIMDLAASDRNFAFSTGIDFADQIFLPLRNGWVLKSCDMVVVDECLPAETPVMLHDGTSTTIRQIVESDKDIVVRSYNTETNQPQNCRVIGRQKILNQKPLVKISTRHNTSDLSGRGANFVVCTIDHKIWTTNRGWVEAGKIVAGDKAIVETAAIKNQAYKITTAGSQKLSKIHEGNTKGVGNGDREFFTKMLGSVGNGRGPTLAEQTLATALGEGWITNYTFFTKKKSIDGYPHHYKIDIANLTLKIAVEVDGKLHRNSIRQTADQKKQTLIEAAGWKMFRVTNRQAIQHTADEVCRITATGCPREATVVAVSPVEIPDNYVYDITVEDCHNFYANGVLVHNCQDMTNAQLDLAIGISRGRIIIVGDDRQAIFGFRGADSGSIARLKAQLNAKELKMTKTFRCGRVIVDMAKTLVPDFEAGPDNPNGEIVDMSMDKLVADAQEGNFVVSRLNAPLVGVAMSLLRSGKRTKIAGKDIGAGIKALVNRLNGRGGSTVEVFLEKLQTWETREVSKWTVAKRPDRAENVCDQADTIRELTDNVTSVAEVLTRIDNLFTDLGLGAAGVVTCSSIHKAKGLEAEKVYVLMNTLYLRGVSLEETNLHYVAITRAKQTLVLVT